MLSENDAITVQIGQCIRLSVLQHLYTLPLEISSIPVPCLPVPCLPIHTCARLLSHVSVFVLYQVRVVTCQTVFLLLIANNCWRFAELGRAENGDELPAVVTKGMTK